MHDPIDQTACSCGVAAMQAGESLYLMENLETLKDDIDSQIFGELKRSHLEVLKNGLKRTEQRCGISGTKAIEDRAMSNAHEAHNLLRDKLMTCSAGQIDLIEAEHERRAKMTQEQRDREDKLADETWQLQHGSIGGRLRP